VYQTQLLPAAEARSLAGSIAEGDSDARARMIQANLRLVRSHTTTPLAIGEVFNSIWDCQQLISEQLIDFIRAHMSAIGGLTPARKLAALAEAFGVRTAWHGPGDVSPVGHAANLHLDLACHHFGVQEVISFGEPLYEVASGIPELRHGYRGANDAPGLGVAVNETEAARHPFEQEMLPTLDVRAPDGATITSSFRRGSMSLPLVVARASPASSRVKSWL